MGQDRRARRRHRRPAAGLARSRRRRPPGAAGVRRIYRCVRSRPVIAAAHAVRVGAGAGGADAGAGERGCRLHRRPSCVLRSARHALRGARRRRLARQPPPLRALGLGRRGARPRRRPELAPRHRALPRLARRARSGLSACRRCLAPERLHRSQPGLSGLFPGRAVCRSRLAGEFFRDRRSRVLRRPVVLEGRAVLCRPADDGQPDLCARDPDPGLRLGPRRAVAHPRRCADRHI